MQSRIRYLMEDPHWVTDGEWKESVLRNVLRRYVPETIKVGRGFIYTRDRCSTQIDVLLYDVSYPILFKDGDLVFVTPDAVRGIIEVKSNTDNNIVSTAFDKLADNAAMINHITNPIPCFTGLFSYDTDVRNHQRLLHLLKEKSNGDIKRVITHVALGTTIFSRFWSYSPEGRPNRWHTYSLQNNLAPAYFITNVLEWLSPHSVNANEKIWFPLETKETRKIDEIGLLD
ncbi:hypothetical protein DFP97_101411 [Paenibacillus prosopidis]|uniref:DUF6602 domain-containing protein n=2 Tax=Paenibacillus prosopidis TaxID=630520 RepID=A0A368W8V2_9BACL|nr:hypothetical protein DFP97_101411 [Paenibacillus prosopidis]